jgi:hypothetical protein
MVIHHHQSIPVGQSFEPALVCSLLCHWKKLMKSGYKVTVNWQKWAFKNSRIKRIFTFLETCSTSYGFSTSEAILGFDRNDDDNGSSGARKYHL